MRDTSMEHAGWKVYILVVNKNFSVNESDKVYLNLKYGFCNDWIV